MFNLSFGSYGEDVIYYPYRKAEVRGVVEINCDSEEDKKQYVFLEKKLCSKAKKMFKDGEIIDIEDTIEPSNHTCFVVGDTAIEFSDNRISIGTEIIIH